MSRNNKPCCQCAVHKKSNCISNIANGYRTWKSTDVWYDSLLDWDTANENEHILGMPIRTKKSYGYPDISCHGIVGI